MKKVILTKRTMGVVIDRLRNVTSGIYRIDSKKDTKPLRCKIWDDFIMVNKTACAEISPHWMMNNRNWDGKTPDDPGFPLIFMAIDAEHFQTFEVGNVFYFKGNSVIINNTSDLDLRIWKCRNIVKKITCIKRFKDLNMEEIISIQKQKEWAEESAREFERIVEMDMRCGDF